MKALRYAYANRRKKKRNFRRLWITRLNAAIRANGFNYSEFLYFLKNLHILLNRKVLAQFSICDPETFVKFIHSIEKIKFKNGISIFVCSSNFCEKSLSI